MSKKKKIVLAVIGVVIITPIILLAIAIRWQGSTEPIRAVADQFKVPSDWKLESEQIRPPQLICLDGGTCPMLHRSWRTQGTTKEALNEVLKNTRWQTTIDEDCHFPKGASGSTIILCSTESAVEGFKLTLDAIGNSDYPDKPHVVLNISPM